MGWIETRETVDGTRYRGKYRHAGKRVPGPWCAYPHLAEQWLTEAEAEAKARPVELPPVPKPPPPPDPGDVTLGTFAAKWLTEQTDIGKETRRYYRTHVTLGIVEDPIAEVRLADLDREHVREWLPRMELRGPAARNGSLKVLRMICREALGSKRYPLTVDPTYKIKKARRKRRAMDHPSGKTGDRVYLSPSSVEALLDQAGDNDTYRLMILLGVEAGLRWSEMAGLLVDAIEDTGDGMRIVVKRTLSDGKIVNDTKNHRDRAVPILDAGLRRELAAAVRRARLRAVGSGRDALLLVAPPTRRPYGKMNRRANGKIQASVLISGTTRRLRQECADEVEAQAWIAAHPPAPKPLRYGQCQEWFNAACAAADIYPVPLGWHDLRHTCASRMAGDGVPMTVISEVLGHAALAITSTYVHVPPEVVLQHLTARAARRIA